MATDPNLRGLMIDDLATGRRPITDSDLGTQIATTRIKLAANSTVGLADFAYIPFDTAVIDDAELFVTNGQITIPATAARYRISAAVNIVYNAANSLTYMRVLPEINVDAAPLALATVGAKAAIAHAGSGAISLDVVYDSGWIDAASLGAINYVTTFLRHVSAGTNGGVANSVFVGANSWLQLEVEY